MKEALLTAVACCCLGVGAVVAEAPAGSLVANGRFDTDTAGWTGFRGARRDGQLVAVPAPQLLSWDDADGVGNVRGCLKVVLTGLDRDCHIIDTGAYVAFTHPVPAGTPVHIRFAAKSINGSRRLIVARPSGGGGTASVLMSPEWQLFSLDFVSKFLTPGVLISIIDHYNDDAWHVEAGEFLLDNVRVSPAGSG